MLAREVTNFINHAHAERARTRARRSTGLVPATARHGDWGSHEFRTFPDEVSAALEELLSAERRAAGPPQRLPVHYQRATTAMPYPPFTGATALCSMCHHPVQAVYLAPVPPAQMKRLGGRARQQAELVEDVRHVRKRGSKASGRRQDAAESLAATVVKAIAGTGMLLAVAVIVTSITFRATRPTGEPIAHEQHDVDDARMVAGDNARSATGAQAKPFVDRLERVPTGGAGAAQAPAAAPAPIVTAALIATTHDGMAVRAAPSPRARFTEPVATLEVDEIDRVDPDLKQQRAKAKSVARVASPQAAGTSSPALPKVAAASKPRAPVNMMRAEAKPSAAEDADTGDGLYVAVLSTHKEASAARDEFAELNRKYAAILGSKQSEVQVMTGQTGSWHRLVATPASTKAVANQICNDLRAAGYGRCWVKAY